MADEDVTPTETDEGAVEAPSVVAEPEAPSYDWGELADDELVVRHGRDPVKVAQSYKALTQEFHQRGWEERNGKTTPEAPAEPETPWEPLQDVQAPANVDPAFYAKVGHAYRLDPVGTFRELVTGGDEYAIYAEAVYTELKAQVGEVGAANILAQIHGEQQQAQIEALLAERVDAQVTPITNEAKTGKVSAGIDLAKAVIGDEAWAKFEPYLSSVVPQGGLPAHIVESPTLLRDTLVELQQYQVFREQQALNAAAAEPTPTPIPSRRGADATLSGNTASRPGDQSYEDQVRASMKSTKVRLTD